MVAAKCPAVTRVRRRHNVNQLSVRSGKRLWIEHTPQHIFLLITECSCLIKSNLTRSHKGLGARDLDRGRVANVQLLPVVAQQSIRRVQGPFLAP